MATKKKSSIDDALNVFKDVMERSSLSDYVHVDRKIISKNQKNNSIIIIPEQDLWLALINDNEIKSHLKELDLSNAVDRNSASLFKYSDSIDDDSKWISVNIDELFNGKIIKVKVSNKYDYDVPINKNVLPLKLRKAEFNNIQYRVFKDDHVILALKKKFVYEGIPDASFTIIKLFKVV